MQKLLSDLVQAPPFMYYILIGIVIIVSISSCLVMKYKNKYPHDTKYDLNQLYKYYPHPITVKRVNNTLVVKSRSISFTKTKPFINMKANNKNVIKHECQDSDIYDRRDELLGD